MQSISNIDTVKMQTVIGILSGVILLFIILMLIIAANNLSPTNPKFPTWLEIIYKISWWILNGCALVLIILGGWNIVKGNIGYGIAGVFFGLLWFIAMWFHANINYNWHHENIPNGINKNYSFCLELQSPFH